MGIPAYGRGFQLVNWEEPNVQDGLYCLADKALPAGPYTLQKGFFGYQEIMQALYNDSLPALPEATPKAWKSVTDDCYKAPYIGEFLACIKAMVDTTCV